MSDHMTRHTLSMHMPWLVRLKSAMFETGWHMPSINSKSLKTNKLPLQRIAKIDNDDSTGTDTVHNNTENTHDNDDGNNKNDMEFTEEKKKKKKKLLLGRILVEMI